MKSKFSLILFVFYILGCSPQKYFLTTNPNTINNYQAITIHDGNPLTTNEKYFFQTKTILVPKQMESNIVMEKTINLINEKKYNKLAKYLKNTSNINEYNYFASGLLKMHQKKYKMALEYFNLNTQTDIQYIIDILIVDCELELSLIKSSNCDFTLFLEKYQKIMDTYQLDQNYKEIINNRIKYIRYIF